MQLLKTKKINYKSFIIELTINSNTAIIYKNESIVKCIAGDIFKDGTNNALFKSKKFINTYSK